MSSRPPDPTQSSDADALVRAHAPWLMGWFRVRGVRTQDAEELVQETLLRLLRNRRSQHDPMAMPAWLLRTARDLLGRRHAARTTVALDLERHTPVSSGELEGTEAERQGELSAALTSLPDELQQVILARYSRGQTYEQCAATLGLSRATVQSRLRRALTTLRRQLSHDVTPTKEAETR